MIVLVTAIADEHTFFVNHLVRARFGVITVVNGIVGPASLEGDGKMARGVDGAEEDFGERRAAALSPDTRVRDKQERDQANRRGRRCLPR